VDGRVKLGHDEGDRMKLASLKHRRDGRLVVVFEQDVVRSTPSSS
jgi:hypothetical protein